MTPNSNWVAPPTNTGWLSPSVDTRGDAGATWAYRVAFQLPEGADPSTAAVVGRVAADDACYQVNVNDVRVPSPFGTADDPTYTALVPFVLKGQFQAGYNWIDFFVSNVGGPTGILVIIDGATVAPLGG